MADKCTRCDLSRFRKLFKNVRRTSVQLGVGVLATYVERPVVAVALIVYTVCDFGGHAFIKIGRYYYDAQAPRGVTDWRRLPFFADGEYRSSHAKRQTGQSFRKYWRYNGRTRIIPRTKAGGT